MELINTSGIAASDDACTGGAHLTRTGRRAGCSCCSLTALGAMALPGLLLAVLVALFRSRSQSYTCAQAAGPGRS